jgi:hypothetical protein
MYPFTFSTLIRPFIRPKPHYIWAQVRILYETDKTTLVYCCGKHWIPKARIYDIRLKNGRFEVYVEESVVGR